MNNMTMNRNVLNPIMQILLVGLLTFGAGAAQAEVLCKNKKTGAVSSRPATCKKGELVINKIAVSATSTKSTAETVLGNELSLTDSGAVASGSDLNTGLDVNVTRSGATGGTINTAGVNIDVVGDGGGDSTNVGLLVSATGADTNYSALFSSGNVGIGVNDPDEALELNGRLHLNQTSAPSSTTDKLYNVGGLLFWNGQEVNLGTGTEGTITGVTAGSGLSGGGTSGVVSLSVDAGSTANKIVQLNSSAELPAVSGANLTALNAGSISSGVLSDSRLSSNVSMLGTSIGLSSEVSGTLPVINGGTGAATLSDLITLGSHTVGNYVQSVATSAGLSGGAAASEGGALTLSIDQTFTPTWTGVHSFQSGANIGTTTTSSEILHLNGRLHVEPQSAPSVTTDKLYNVGGALFFNGLNLTTGAAGGDITDIDAGVGLTGGGANGDVTIDVDVGTAAGQIVQLNGSAQLPAVSGVNLTALNATNLTSGTVSDSRLSSVVTKLGATIDLTSEVTGTLPVGSGGTGATSLSNLIALGSNTTGNYVTSVSGGTGITATGATAAEGSTPSFSIDQSFAPIWTGTHTFSGIAPDITTGSNEDFSIVPNGSGSVGIGTSTPLAKLHTSVTSTSSTAGTVTANRVSLADTGNVSSGTDSNTGLLVDVSRTTASGGIIDATGATITVLGDTGGTSTATGLSVAVSGADTNYAALFSGGAVGIGTSSPVARLDTVLSSTSISAGTEYGSRVTVQDTGIVPSGVDTTYGILVDLDRTGASGGTILSTGLDLNVTGSSGGTSTTTGLNVAVSGADTNYAALFSGGFVGIGTSTPTANLDTALSSSATTGGTEIGGRFIVADAGVVNSGTDDTYGLIVDLDRTGASGGNINSTGLDINVAGTAGGTSATTGLNVVVAGADTNVAGRFAGGSVALGTGPSVVDSDVPSGSLVVDNGAVCVDNGGDNCGDSARTAGVLYSVGSVVSGVDLAEEFPVVDGDEVEAGDIVVANTHRARKCITEDCSSTAIGLVPFVTRSSGDKGEMKRVLGIVSTKPGTTLGGFGQEELRLYRKVPLALAGRVPAKLSVENGAIEVGDRITPSSLAGVGMKAGDSDLVIGIALEPFDGSEVDQHGVGKALVLVK